MDIDWAKFCEEEWIEISTQIRTRTAERVTPLSFMITLSEMGIYS